MACTFPSHIPPHRYQNVLSGPLLGITKKLKGCLIEGLMSFWVLCSEWAHAPRLHSLKMLAVLLPMQLRGA